MIGADLTSADLRGLTSRVLICARRSLPTSASTTRRMGLQFASSEFHLLTGQATGSGGHSPPRSRSVIIGHRLIPQSG